MFSKSAERVLFLGAGASRPLGLPLMEELLGPVVSLAAEGWKAKPGKTPTRGQRLAEYLALVHGLDREGVTLLRTGKLLNAPHIVDVLTLLDTSLAENSSFGPLKDSPFGEASIDFTVNELRRVQRTILNLISECVSSARSRSTGTAVAQHNAVLRAFADQIVMTTNWDANADRTLWGTPKSASSWRPAARHARYTPVGETLVTYGGDVIDPQPLNGQWAALLKLHGSLNWLYCPRCHRLVVNLAADLVPDEEEQWMDDACWCESTLEPLIVMPSYSKNYANLQLRLVWREALNALAMTRAWVFVGYSMPQDDFAVRGLLTRALAWKRSAGLPMPVVEVYDFTPESEREEANALALRGAPPDERMPSATRRFLETVQRYGSVLGRREAAIRFDAGGLAAAAERYSAPRPGPP